MSVLYAMVLLGCTDDGSTCQRLAEVPRTYRSEASCKADQDTVLGSEVALSADFPMVETRCVAANTLARSVKRAGRARAEIRLR